MFAKVVLLLTVAVVGLCSANLTAKCMNCMCQVESNCNPNIGCIMDEGSLSCGPYQIKDVYWQDCGRPGPGWQECANDMGCAETCIRAYMDRYALYCTGGRQPKCEDYSRIHNGGPQGCNQDDTIFYWDRMRTCCGCQTCCD